MWPIISTHYDAERRVWSGPTRRDLYSENITLGEVICDRLLRNPKKVIQINDDTGEKMTCEELLRSAETLVHHLLELGVRTGDVIGLYAGNSTHVAAVMLASYLCGTPVHPVFPGDKDTVCTIYEVTRPKIIFCDVENHENAQKVSEELNLNASLIVVNGAVKGLANVRDLLKSAAKPGNSCRFPCLDLKSCDTVAIMCSSGTTGPPKGVLITHQQTINRPVFVTSNSDSVVFTSSAMYWVSGLWTLNTSLLNACLRIVTDKAFTPEYFLDLVQRYKITHVFTNARQIAKLLLMADAARVQESLATIDSLMTGGAKVPLAVQERINKILSNNLKRPGLCVAYAMTELGGMLAFNSAHLPEGSVGSEGKLMPNMEVRVISKDGDLLGPNERGEICIRTTYSWPGYYRNEEAKRKAFVDGWLHTGDIGYFNDEGFLHLCAREADVFKSRNFHIYPQSLEELIVPLAGVLEVCVVGIPDLLASHVIGCAVVRTADENGRNLTVPEIEDAVKSKMASMYHLSGGVYFLDAMPKTATGKIQRKKVLEIVLKIREMDVVA